MSFFIQNIVKYIDVAVSFMLRPKSYNSCLCRRSWQDTIWLQGQVEVQQYVLCCLLLVWWFQCCVSLHGWGALSICSCCIKVDSFGSDWSKLSTRV